MSTPELSDREREIVARFEAAPYPAEVGAIRDWRRANSGCCPRCGWHLSSHGSSHGPRSDCPWGTSPSAADGSLCRAQEAGLS